ncbi:MAG: TonB-dependent receptor [Nitrospirota bacterium]
MRLKRISILCILFIFLIYPFTPALAISEEEKTFLEMYFKPEELQIISATRSLKSISRVAENISVVTADDIELMNAHTVAEALYNVTGIEIIGFVGPGAQGLAGIHGADYTRVAVLLDGVPIQNASNGFALGILPVQMIEKIEIIKGPASSIWGSSFGGVINIITKSVKEGDHISATVYASGGERNTSDLRAEISGRRDNLGIYLYSGTMNSDGLRNRHEFWHNNFFSKVTLDAGEKTRMDISFLYHKSDSVQWDYLDFGWDAYDAYVFEHIYGRAALRTELHKYIDLNVSAWMFLMNDGIYENTASTEQRIWDADSHFDKYGFSGSLTWRAGVHTIVAGTDIMNGRFRTSASKGDVFKQRKYAFYINDTISINKLSITPGLRYDNSNLGGDILSPGLGITYLVSKDLLFRALVSRGFHDPKITDTIDDPINGFVGNPDIEPEKIWTYQLGAEANLKDILRIKLTLFRHDIEDIILDKELGGGMFTVENAGRQRTIGGEFEITTKTYRGFTFKCGFHYERIKLLDFSDVRWFGVTRQYGLNSSLTYSSGNGLRAMLKGHYLWWHAPKFWEARYNGFILDFNIIKEILKMKGTSLEAFFTAHNILDSSSYNDTFTRNPHRWIEAGMRYRF